MESRIESLEIKISHLEMSVDNLTHTTMEQQKQLIEQSERIERMMSMLKQLTPASIASEAEETLPPHY